MPRGGRQIHYNWVTVRRTYVFTLQEVEKICQTLQSHVMQHRTINYLAQDSDEVELLPVAIFSVEVLAQIAQDSHLTGT